MLENLTIVVITYERYDCLKRLLNFYLSYNSEVKILVLDSSSFDPEDEELLKILSNKKISWIRFSSETFFLKKIAEGCSYIDTEFSVLSADDDFLIPTGIEECRIFLKENLDFSSAQGLSYLHFKSSFLKSKLRVENLYQETAYALDDSSSLDRLTKYLTGESKNYPFYAVHRSKDFLKIWTYARQYADHQGLSEILPCCLSLVLGKMKVMDNFYNFREPNDFSNWEDQKTLDKVYSQERVSKALYGLTNFIVHETNQKQGKVEQVCKHLFDLYLSTMHEKQKFLQIKSKSSKSWTARLKEIVRIRSRLREVLAILLYEGSNYQISKNYLSDFKKAEKMILDSNVDTEYLNKSRAKVEYKET